jgi:drug/metabolite transporter (DMT)-like permease
MTLTSHALALGCVLLMAAGQLLFKTAANAVNAAGTFMDMTVAMAAAGAVAIYALASGLWIVLLQSTPLSRAYPYMALSFVLVAAGSWLFFRESISLGQIAGLALIVGGLLVTAAS